MPVVLKVVGLANQAQLIEQILQGAETDIYLQSFDHEARDGFGVGVFTEDIGKAMRFVDVAEAMAFWQRSPTNHPIRSSDGKPNRPLTAWTVEIIRLPAAAPAARSSSASDRT